MPAELYQVGLLMNEVGGISHSDLLVRSKRRIAGSRYLQINQTGAAREDSTLRELFEM